MLALGAGSAGAGRAGRARGACVLGLQGARGRQACVGRKGGRPADGRQRRAGRAQQGLQERGLGAGRAAWAPGLARTVHSVHPT